jgi:hypothetical protein
LRTSAPAAQTSGDLGAPGVHADDEVRELLAYPGHEAGGPADLLRGVDLLAGPRLHPADVDEVRAGCDHVPDPVQRRLLGERRAVVVEGVLGPVDDRHHQQVGVGERPASQLQHGRDSTRARG